MVTHFFLSRLDEVQSENMKMKVENNKLLRKVETIKNENHNIAMMEQEKDSLKQTVGQMKATIESLQKTQAKQVNIKFIVIILDLIRSINWDKSSS